MSAALYAALAVILLVAFLLLAGMCASAIARVGDEPDDDGEGGLPRNHGAHDGAGS